MDRKEFLIKTWYYLFRPVIIILVVCFCIQFIVNCITQNGSERFIAIIVAIYIGLTLLVYLIGLLFNTIISRINSKLNEPTRNFLFIIGKLLNFIFWGCLAVAICYFCYHKNYMALLPILFASVITFNTRYKIKHEEKQE